MLRHLDSASAEASEEAARSGRLRLQRSSTMPSHRGLRYALLHCLIGSGPLQVAQCVLPLKFLQWSA